MTKRLLAVAIGLAVVMSAATAEAKHRHKKSHAKASYSHQHRGHHPRYAKRTARHYARSGATADRGCLTPTAKNLLARIEAQFGRVQVISTCRPGAVVAGTGHPSKHRYGMAIDFKTSQKAAVVRWLIANNRGGTMTYSHSDHIHADVGPHFVSLAGQRTRVASASRRGRDNADLAWGSGDSDGASTSTRRHARHARHAGRSGHPAGQSESRGLHSVL